VRRLTKESRARNYSIHGIELLAYPTSNTRLRKINMLWTIFVILLILWLLGMVSSYTLGGYIHLLLVIALVVVIIRVIQGRNPV
jgi:hypothetical protein